MLLLLFLFATCISFSLNNIDQCSSKEPNATYIKYNMFSCTLKGGKKKNKLPFHFCDTRKAKASNLEEKLACLLIHKLYNFHIAIIKSLKSNHMCLTMIIVTDEKSDKTLDLAKVYFFFFFSVNQQLIICWHFAGSFVVDTT